MWDEQDTCKAIAGQRFNLARAAPKILAVVKSAEKAKAALAAAFDDPAVTELRVFNLGDGGAMSGILIAGRRAATGEATFLVFLLD